jgi:DNA-binding NarL/FixJ family response regulator
VSSPMNNLHNNSFVGIILQNFGKESMPLGGPIPAITLSDQLHRELQVMVGPRSLPQALAQRARIILLAATGLSNTAIAQQLSLSDHTVEKWCRCCPILCGCNFVKLRQLAKFQDIHD